LKPPRGVVDLLSMHNEREGANADIDAFGPVEQQANMAK